jgi:hypothetical protein
MKIYITLLLMATLAWSCNSKQKPTGSAEVTEKNGEHPNANQTTGDTHAQTTKIDPPTGGISVDELFKNRQKYDGQIVKVKGKCVKLNTNIMNRNWIHLQDGSMTDEGDLTVTTIDKVALGDIVAFEGKITLNKDFGAGYKYDIIMEEARLLP